MPPKPPAVGAAQRLGITEFSSVPGGTSAHRDIPHIISDSTLGAPLDAWGMATSHYHKWDVAVRREGGLPGPEGRILAQSGVSFAMSGKAMKNHQMAAWIADLDLGHFDLVFVVPMVRSIPPRRESSYDVQTLQRYQSRAWAGAKAWPSLMDWDRELKESSGKGIYEKQESHMRPDAMSRFLSSMLSLLPSRRCLLLIVGWNANLFEAEFASQRRLLGGDLGKHQGPFLYDDARAAAFLKNLCGTKAEGCEATARWFGAEGWDEFAITWRPQTGFGFTEASEARAEQVLELAARYLEFLAGGPPPDDETWWKLPEEMRRSHQSPT
jgi:hypothetical protein